MLNYKEIKIGNIFKRGIKISNILDIDQEYAKKNQNDNKKLLYFKEILNSIGAHYEEIIPYIINSGDNNYSTLIKLLDDSKYYGLKINAKFNTPNEINSLKLEYDNDLNPLMCLDMAIHLILIEAGVGLFNFKSIIDYIQEDANKSLIDNHIIDMLITGELFKIIKSASDYKKYSLDIISLINFTFDFTKISSEFNDLQKQNVYDILLTLRRLIIKVLKVRIENKVGLYFIKELNDVVFTTNTIIRKLVLENEGDKFIENNIIPVLNKLYKNYDKINLKFTNEDVKYRNIACKNVKIKEEISRVYLGVNNYFKYSF